MDVATFVASVFNYQLPFRVEAYDGSVATPTITSSANVVTLKILSRDALTRVLTHPGELGLARAYVAGDLDIDGELDALFELSVPPVRQLLKVDNLRSLLSVVGLNALRPIAPRSRAGRGASRSRGCRLRAGSTAADSSPSARRRGAPAGSRIRG